MSKREAAVSLICLIIAMVVLITIVTGNIHYFEDQSMRIYDWSVCLGTICN